MKLEVSDIGRLCREERLAQGITQEDLSERTGEPYVSVATISRLENGRQISVDKLLQVLDGLGLEVSVIHKLERTEPE